MTGSLVAAVGAALLAVSVFQPWYAFKLTASGVASAQQTINSLAVQYGNAAFQSQARGLGSSFSALAGHQVATLSAHQALKYLHVVLLILAAIVFLLALFHLAGTSQPTQASGDQIAPIGVMATLCVLFRMVDRPVAQEEVFSLSLSSGRPRHLRLKRPFVVRVKCCNLHRAVVHQCSLDSDCAPFSARVPWPTRRAARLPPPDAVPSGTMRSTGTTISSPAADVLASQIPGSACPPIRCRWNPAAVIPASSSGTSSRRRGFRTRSPSVV
jgi:hypothetical protein